MTDFYLGGIVDPSTGDRTDALLDGFDADDLTTHGVIVGMTGSGKTGLGVIFLEEALRSGIPTIVIDPKGDADLLKRMYVEAQRAGREGEFYIFHLSWPEISARYNAVGRFGRISEVATRIAGQLSEIGRAHV